MYAEWCVTYFCTQIELIHVYKRGWFRGDAVLVHFTGLAKSAIDDDDDDDDLLHRIYPFARRAFTPSMPSRNNVHFALCLSSTQEKRTIWRTAGFHLWTNQSSHRDTHSFRNNTITTHTMHGKFGSVLRFATHLPMRRTANKHGWIANWICAVLLSLQLWQPGIVENIEPPF